ncbi:MAG: PDZ domain-containing protein [bacterium]|nr:PDZ domain-containing protein [bacterium]
MATKLGICTGGIVAVLGFRAAAGEQQELAATTPTTQRAEAADAGAFQPVELESAEVELAGRGLTVLPASLELAAHLGLEQGVGFLVQDVESGSAADAAGLKPFDVVLSVDGEAADGRVVTGALAAEKGLALRIARAGVVRDVALGTATEASADGFLSWETLAPEHPFRRLVQVQTLREDYSNRAEGYSERIRALDDEARTLRKQAKGARQELEQAFTEQISTYLEALRSELLEQIDAGLSAELAARIPGLRLDLAELLPAQRLQGVDTHLEELIQSLKSELGKVAPIVVQGVVQGEDAQDEKRARRQFARVGEESAKLLSERIVRTWSEGRRALDKSSERLGAKHDQRTTWVVNTVAAIRDEVRERANCAVDRSREELASALSRRLSKHDVPAPGELAAALSDLSLQLEEFTSYFITRTGAALEVYVQELGSARTALAATLTGSLEGGERASTELATALATAREAHLEQDLPLDGTWRDRTRVDARAEELATALLVAVNHGRDAMRGGTMAWQDGLREERVIAEDAWSDLRRVLSTLKSEAADNCWTLDGPHLDGRFPKQEEKKRRGTGDEVALLGR